MSYSHAVFGEIRIHPPLNRAQALDPRWRKLWDLTFELTETDQITDESPCQRIFIRDGLVVTVEPEITWPEGAR
jgi:hypothetical protein